MAIKHLTMFFFVIKQAALLLQAQYNEGRRQLDDGVIEPKEWRRISARLANSVLKTLQKIKPAKPVNGMFI